MEQNANKTKFVFFGVTALAIIAIIVSVIIVLTGGLPRKTVNELKSASETLIKANFDAVCYYKISTLTMDNNFNPDDFPNGVVPCNTAIFKSYDELANFVKNTYIPEEADKILATKNDGLDRYMDINGKLCMSVVSPDTTYKKDFSTIKYSLKNMTEESADIEAIVKNESGGTDVIELSMVRINDKWLLNNMAY